ncbi:MAG: FAD-dependent oxidoreductase, partial [Nocardioidaceae bacterium]|nr:FAD-dependent oxidoreductase [Nocardioidaceae bacterium]
MPQMKSVAVIGGGMVGHRFVEALSDRDEAGVWQIHLFCEEPRAPYDRVALTSYFAGNTPDDLLMGEESLWDRPEVSLHVGSPVLSIDSATKTVTTNAGAHTFDAIVISTGSSAAVPPVGGADLPGAFVYRTIEDVQAIEQWAQGLP